MDLPDSLLFLTRALVLIVESGIFGTLAVSAFAGRPVGRRMLRALFGALLCLFPIWLLAQSAQMADTHSLAAIPGAVALVLQASWVGHLAVARAAAWTMAWFVAFMWLFRGNEHSPWQ